MTQNTESMMADLRARLKEEHEKPLLLTGDTASYTREIEAVKKQARKEALAEALTACRSAVQLNRLNEEQAVGAVLCSAAVYALLEEEQ